LIPIPSSEPEVKITVAQALIKGDRWEWFLEKAVELGACEIIPLVTEHTVVRPEKGEGPKKLQRWEKILLAAAKQSGRAKIPSIGEPLALEKWLSGMGKNDGAKKLVCSERDGECATLPEKGENIIVAVGPEGGWSESELGAFSRKGFAPLSLGPLILRSETAALKALSLLCR
ncbi:16S rRNA (uracil(1498)-N(3))-methyltransferase, partial [bacterium]